MNRVSCTQYTWQIRSPLFLPVQFIDDGRCPVSLASFEAKVQHGTIEGTPIGHIEFHMRTSHRHHGLAAPLAHKLFNELRVTDLMYTVNERSYRYVLRRESGIPDLRVAMRKSIELIRILGVNMRRRVHAPTKIRYTEILSPDLGGWVDEGELDFFRELQRMRRKR